jgi:hypothetical protein
MKTLPEARRLAATLAGIGRGLGKEVTALLTAMDQPLGWAVGNALEVVESIELLRGGGPDDLRQLTVALGAEMVLLARLAPDLAAEKLIIDRITSHYPRHAILAEESGASEGATSIPGESEWRWIIDPLDGNMRDHATVEQLLVLANIEGMNAEFIHMNLAQGDRLKRLNQIGRVELRIHQDFPTDRVFHQKCFQALTNSTAILRPFDDPLIEDHANADIPSFKRDPPAPPAIADDMIRRRPANAVRRRRIRSLRHTSGAPH